MSAPEREEVVPHGLKALRRARVVLWIAVAVGVPMAIFVAILASSEPAVTRAADSPLLSKPAPDVEAKSIDGEIVRLSDFRGRWVLVNFFATWCIPCVEEHPDLVNFSASHRATGDAAILGVVYSDSEKAVKEFRAEKGGDWPMLTDSNGRISLEFGVSGIPESFLVTPDGVVVSKIIGGIQRPELESLLQQAKRAHQAGR